MGAGPSAVVAAPPAGAARHGLVLSAVRPTDPDNRWTNGITYEPEGCYSGDLVDPCGSDEKDDPSPRATVEWEPYGVVATYRCSAMAANGKDWQGIVRRRLEAVRSFQIERELWTGDLATANSWPNRFLADVDNVDILTESAGVGLTHGLACLTQYLAETNGGQQGMIHATAQTVTHWDSLGLLRKEGARLYNWRDDIVVGGSGYDGSDPDGNNAVTGDVWAYATDLVEVRLADVMVIGRPDDPSFVDRTLNTARIRAEQLALASWEGCRHGGARLDLTTCGVGGS